MNFEKPMVWILGLAVAVAVFFQFHVTVSDTLINLSLADPFAILALMGVSLRLLLARQQPLWRVEKFNLALGAISLITVLAFMRGWLEIGITPWALSARLAGWFVLLGYLSVGYLIAASFGEKGLRRFSETLGATAASIVILQVTLRILDGLDVIQGISLTQNFEGYAGNRNAFAFQLLTVLSLLLCLSPVSSRYDNRLQRPKRSWTFSFLLGVLLAALVWTGSRAGILVGVVLLAARFGCLADRGILSRALMFAVLIYGGVWLLGLWLPGFSTQSRFSEDAASSAPTPPSARPGFSTQSRFSEDASNHERWAIMVHALSLWQQSPILGIGLGVFMAKSPALMGYPQVIHSTLLWILTEFGLAGAAVFAWVFFILVRYAIKSGKIWPTRSALLPLLMVFAIFGLVHEIFYQRIFWLVLGIILAQPFSFRVLKSPAAMRAAKSPPSQSLG